MILDLINRDESDIKYVIHQFPDGEKHFELLDEIPNERFSIKCRIKSGDDIFILDQIFNIVNNFYSFNEAPIIDVHIYYLMSMRMDRAMSDKRAFSLDLVQSMLCYIEDTLAVNYMVYEPHSDKCFGIHQTLPWLEQYSIPKDAVICFPDKGAKERYSGLFPDNQIMYANKTRDKDGNLSGLKLEYDGKLLSGFTEVYVIDDLCDGGGTFVRLAEELDKWLPGIKRTLCVTHMIQEQAIHKLSNYYNQLVFTNSFQDWISSWDCVKVIDIIS